MKKFRGTSDIRYHVFSEDTDTDALSKTISRDDLIIVASARKGTISYNSQIENIPGRLMRQFTDHNFIVLYPEQTQVDFPEGGMQSQDLKLAPIQEQIDNLNKLGKVVKKIFKGGGAKSEHPGVNDGG